MTRKIKQLEVEGARAT